MKKILAAVLILPCLVVFTGCAAKEPSAADTPDAMVPAIIYGGNLYRTTGKQIPAEVDPSAIVGEIRSVVPLTQLPAREGEANFGQIGDPYAMTADGLLVSMNQEWVVFELFEME